MRSNFHLFVRLSVCLSRACADFWLCRHIIVPMSRLPTGGLALQRQARSNTLAVLACVRCQGGPLYTCSVNII